MNDNQKHATLERSSIVYSASRLTHGYKDVAGDFISSDWFNTIVLFTSVQYQTWPSYVGNYILGFLSSPCSLSSNCCLPVKE